jgi:hypothetical protein
LKKRPRLQGRAFLAGVSSLPDGKMTGKEPQLAWKTRPYVNLTATEVRRTMLNGMISGENTHPLMGFY